MTNEVRSPVHLPVHLTRDSQETFKILCDLLYVREMIIKTQHWITVCEINSFLPAFFEKVIAEAPGNHVTDDMVACCKQHLDASGSIKELIMMDPDVYMASRFTGLSTSGMLTILEKIRTECKRIKEIQDYFVRSLEELYFGVGNCC